MNIIGLAKKFGLTDKQAEVYRCLFSFGSATAAEIVQRTGLNRTLVYDYSNILVEKGLASFNMVNNKRTFYAVEPKLLAENLEEQLDEFEKEKKSTLQEVRTSLKELEGAFRAKEEASVSILLGVRGVRNLFKDVVSSLNRGQEDLVFIANYEGRELLGETIENYYAQCGRKGVRVRVIFDSRPKTAEVGEKTAKLPFVKVRYLPAEYSALTTFHVYGDKACLLLFSEGEVFGLLMKNKKVAEGLKKHFEALWKTAKT